MCFSVLLMVLSFFFFALNSNFSYDNIASIICLLSALNWCIFLLSFYLKQIVLLMTASYKFGFRFSDSLWDYFLIRNLNNFTFFVITKEHLFLPHFYVICFIWVLFSLFFWGFVHSTNEKYLNTDVENQNTLSKNKTQVIN